MLVWQIPVLVDPMPTTYSLQDSQHQYHSSPHHLRLIRSCHTQLNTIKMDWSNDICIKVRKIRHQRHIQTTTDLAGSLLCFNPTDPTLHVLERSYGNKNTIGSLILTSDRILANRNVFYKAYNVQSPIMNTFFTLNSGNIQAIKLSQRISKHNVRYEVIAFLEMSWCKN